MNSAMLLLSELADVSVIQKIAGAESPTSGQRILNLKPIDCKLAMCWESVPTLCFQRDDFDYLVSGGAALVGMKQASQPRDPSLAVFQWF
jgi:hypothetical protein